MAKKDFTAMLNISNEQKKEVNLKIENQRLKDTIAELKNNQSIEYNNISIFKLSDINLNSNIRDNYEFEEIKSLADDISIHGQLQPVLITKDNFLIAGYRRYHALKHISLDSEILVNRLDKLNSDINEAELKEIQFAENYQRRDVDNFQLSNLFNWYIEKGYSQKDISDKFKKSKGVVSVIIAIKNLDKQLVNYFKQFQIYNMSYKKFVDTNFENQENFLEKKDIIGYRPIYNIARLTLLDQKRYFLKNYKMKLTQEELDSEFFQDIKNIDTTSDKKEVKAIKNHTKSISKIIHSMEKNVSLDKKKYIDKINENLKNLEDLIEKLS